MPSRKAKSQSPVVAAASPAIEPATVEQPCASQVRDQGEVQVPCETFKTPEKHAPVRYCADALGGVAVSLFASTISVIDAHSPGFVSRSVHCIEDLAKTSAAPLASTAWQVANPLISGLDETIDSKLISPASSIYRESEKRSESIMRAAESSVSCRVTAGKNAVSSAVEAAKFIFTTSKQTLGLDGGYDMEVVAEKTVEKQPNSKLSCLIAALASTPAMAYAAVYGKYQGTLSYANATVDTYLPDLLEKDATNADCDVISSTDIPKKVLKRVYQRTEVFKKERYQQLTEMYSKMYERGQTAVVESFACVTRPICTTFVTLKSSSVERVVAIYSSVMSSPVVQTKILEPSVALMERSKALATYAHQVSLTTGTSLVNIVSPYYSFVYATSTSFYSVTIAPRFNYGYDMAYGLYDTKLRGSVESLLTPIMETYEKSKGRVVAIASEYYVFIIAPIASKASGYKEMLSKVQWPSCCTTSISTSA